jgi:hypothetical protein
MRELERVSYANLKLSEPANQSFVQVVHVQVANLFEAPLARHYTNHSIKHAHRVLECISKLLDGFTKKLSENEKVILITATLLHDIGMQTTKYIGYHDPEKPLDFKILEDIREHHHEFSEKLILESVNSKPSDRYYLGLELRRDLVDIIATVAKHHRRCDINLLKDPVVAGNIVRIKLLSSLLRLGDCLDLDYRRVDISSLLATEIPLRSQLFWYCHHYVQGVEIDKLKLTVFFRFPDAYKHDLSYQQVVIDYVKKELGNQMDEVYDILDSYGIRLHKNIECTNTYSLTLERMTNNLETYIRLLSRDNVVLSKDVFDVFPTRDICIDNIINDRLKNEEISALVFFGGIASRLCQGEDISKISSWLKKNKNANVYICFEDETIAKLRASELDPSTIPTGNLPNEPFSRYEMKLANIKKSSGIYPDEVRKRVHYISLSKSLNTYPVMVDEDLYCNILTEVRSSESTTAKMRSNNVGIKTKLELLSYMIFILNNSGKTDETQTLIEHIQGMHRKLSHYKATFAEVAEV